LRNTIKFILAVATTILISNYLSRVPDGEISARIRREK